MGDQTTGGFDALQRQLTVCGLVGLSIFPAYAAWENGDGLDHSYCLSNPPDTVYCYSSGWCWIWVSESDANQAPPPGGDWRTRQCPMVEGVPACYNGYGFAAPPKECEPEPTSIALAPWSLQAVPAAQPGQCVKPNKPKPCKPDIDSVPETQLLAAIVYGESSVQQVKEEMYGIASAMIRKRDAWKKGAALGQFLKKHKGYAYVVSDGNTRYKELMCASDAKKYELAYEAAKNALAYGVDYSNGGCFWDGVTNDLKKKGEKHYRYKLGFVFASESHNIFNVPSPAAKNKKGSLGGYYDYTFDSTAAYGDTVFWRYNLAFIKAEGVLQCR